MSISLRAATWPKALIALVLVLVFALGAISPAFAETAGQRSTRNILLGAVALTAGIIIYNNIHHKQVAHNTIVGYTRDGGTVYGDGRIVYPNGQVVYTSNNGRTPCDYDGDGEQCGSYPQAYYPQYQNQPHYPQYQNQPYYPQYQNQDQDDRYQTVRYARPRVQPQRYRAPDPDDYARQIQRYPVQRYQARSYQALSYRQRVSKHQDGDDHGNGHGHGHD